MSRVLCSDEFFIKLLIYKRKKERKKESVLFPILVLHYNELFYFIFHDSWSNTVHTISKLQTTQGQYDGDKD